MMVAGVLSCGHAWQKKRRKISGSGQAAKIAFGLGGAPLRKWGDAHTAFSEDGHIQRRMWTIKV